MNSITLHLPANQLDRLRELAQQNGQTPEEFLRAHLEQWLERQSDFQQAARHVLAKNAELYRRLA
jgi:hypothetical protein